MSALRIYVTRACAFCEHARALGRRVADEVPSVDLEVVDLEEPRAELPPEVVAVPAFLVDGKLFSLGNPSWERLAEVLGVTRSVI
jgi:hypothetical protein